ncbi:MAG TPA: galactose oxidase-like domain-containing protein [Longimicrobium sp.]
MPTRSSGILVQSNWGTKGNFEVVAPVGLGGMVHLWRNNDAAGFPWAPPTWFGAGAVQAAALVRSNYGSPANLEVVARVGGELSHFYRANDLIWRRVKAFASGASGTPAFIQSTWGTNGNFEVVAPLAAGGLAHWWRNNDAAAQTWSAPAKFGGTTRYEAVALIQSSYGSPGNLEVVARTGSVLHHFWRGADLQWHGPGQIATGVAGAPALIEGTWGAAPSRPGNFELVSPLAAGGLGHWWRSNDASQAWSGPAPFGAGAVDAVGLVQGNFGSPGNLEVVARVGARLEHYYRDSATFAWKGPTRFYTEPKCDGAAAGECRVPYESGIVAIHAALLRTGSVVLFAFADNDAQMSVSRVLNPVTGALQTPMHSHHLFCSGHSHLPDGRVFVAGGHHTDVRGMHIYDPGTQDWSHVGDMPRGRWYPTCTTLANGKVMVISGTVIGGAVNPPGNPVNNTVQLFDPASSLLGPERPIPTPWASSRPAFPSVDLYPFVYQLPSGQVLVHSQRTTRFYDPAADTWSPRQVDANHPFTRTYPGEGTSVMLPLTYRDQYRTRVMIMGGGGAWPDTLDVNTPATSTAEVLDTAAATPVWQAVANMRHPRVMPDAVLLPDGTVAVVGGSSKGRADAAVSPVFPVEIFNPATGAWTEMCPLRVPRLYHSTALLLPDGRVMVGGKDGIFNVPPFKYPEHRIEIFSPPYLFRGPRPVITSAPPAAGYGQSITVSTPQAAAVDRVVLLRPGSVTHSFNMDQRLVEVQVTATAAPSLTVRMPPNGNVAPPGWYMLFVLQAGIPSRAHFLRLG